jgi:hypothetical protein
MIPDREPEHELVKPVHQAGGSDLDAPHELTAFGDVPPNRPAAWRLQRTFGGGSSNRLHTRVSLRRFGRGLTILESGGATRGVRRASDDDEYVGLVADDVDHLGGELVQLRATVNCHVPAARQGLVLTAVAIGELELREAVFRTAGAGR